MNYNKYYILCSQIFASIIRTKFTIIYFITLIKSLNINELKNKTL
jgi:hypothetical protein